MWFTQAPVPSPTPTVYLYVDQVGGGGPWPWLTSLAPFAVALVALGGVVWSSLKSAKTTLQAEDRRAAASIAAEDRRAAASIAAEDRRHEHQVDHDDQRWRRDTRAEAYFELVRVSAAIIDCVHQARWLSRDVSAEGEPYRPASTEMVGAQIERWNEYSAQGALLTATIRAVGNAEIAETGRLLQAEASKAISVVLQAAAEADSDGSFDHTRVAAKSIKKLRNLRNLMIASIRQDLGADAAS